MKVTQKQLAFYVLYREHKYGNKAFIPTWKFVGEIHLPEFNAWAMMSYKCPARISDIFNENPGLLEREMVKGKSGAKYYQYRIKDGASGEEIEDPALHDFWKKLYQWRVNAQQ